MSTRIFSAAALGLLLGSCGLNADAPMGEAVTCAIGVGVEMADNCRLEQSGAFEFIVHHPDGGFRRFTLESGEVRTADGASVAIGKTASTAAHMYEFSVEGDVYRIPQSLIGQTPKRKATVGS